MVPDIMLPPIVNNKLRIKRQETGCQRQFGKLRSSLYAVPQILAVLSQVTAAPPVVFWNKHEKRIKDTEWVN